MGFPVFCRGLSIKGTGKNHLGRVGGPVILGGVNVQPGDVVVGDRDGVVVVPAAEADTVLAKAQRRAEKEEDFRQAIREGRSTVELLGLADTLRQLGLD
jgi:4-hydroxy-4-methyl-2-oxoglutarate aldolase